MTKIILVHGDDIYSRAIQAYTWSYYTHAAFELVGGFQLGALSQGVTIAAPKPGTAITRFTLNIPYGERVIAEAAGVAATQLDKPYDWGAIAGLVMHRDWREPSHWFCSELVAWAFEQVGHPLLRANERVNRISPGMLGLSPLLKEVP